MTRPGVTGVTSAVARPATARRRRRGGRLVPWLFISPFLISFVLFFVSPSVMTLTLSFFKYKGYGTATWVGLRNYSALFSNPAFWNSFRNTAFYWLVPLVPLLGGAFLLALLVRSKMTRWPKAVRPLIFLPQIMAPVAAGLVWKVILAGNGVVNSLLGVRIDWTSDPKVLRWSVAFLLVWRGLGWYFVVFLSGLTALPDEVLESAEVDGARAWQRTVYITVPLMKPIFLFALVIDSIGAIQLFTEPSMLIGSPSSPGGGMPPSGAPIMAQVVSNISSGQFGLASAVGWIMFAAAAVFSAIQFRLFRENR